MFFLACLIMIGKALFFLLSTIPGNESSSAMYKQFAHYYDGFYSSKDYLKEALFLKNLLIFYQAQTILDVGCGTGTHISNLEDFGFECSGIDLNSEMVEIARKKVKGQVIKSNMVDFNLERRFDAIISMFAVFNHNLTSENAKSTLKQMKKHLNPGGVLILDLYNSRVSGEKTNHYGNIERVMKWEFDPSNDICGTVIKFIEGKNSAISHFPLKIYSLSVITQYLQEVGFKNIKFYENYSFEEGTDSSKNLIVVAQN